MGLLTTTEDPVLKEARKSVTPSELVCPSCKAPFVASGDTLTAFQEALAIEGHTCPSCGTVISRRRAVAAGF
jgi:hypothetical protein